jgi:hypothetical protein
MNPNNDPTDLSALLEKRHEMFLEWFEPWTACDPEGNDVDAYVTCRASVHDCINLSRLAARQAGRPTMGDDEAHLLSFMTIHWARVVDENAAWMIEALAKRLEAEKELRKAAFAEGFQAGIAARGP